MKRKLKPHKPIKRTHYWYKHRYVGPNTVIHMSPKGMRKVRYWTKY